MNSFTVKDTTFKGYLQGKFFNTGRDMLTSKSVLEDVVMIATFVFFPVSTKSL